VEGDRIILWVCLALAAALLDSAYYALVKRFSGECGVRPLASVSFLSSGAALLFISALRGIPETGPLLIPCVVISAVLNVIAAWLYYRALSISDLSLSMPMISFTPLFLIGTSFLMLNELPSLSGIAGIVLIVAGSYILNTKNGRTGIAAPFHEVLHNRGALMILAVAGIFSIAANVDKVVILNSDTTFGASLTLLLAGTIFSLTLVLAPAPGEGRVCSCPPAALRGDHTVFRNSVRAPFLRYGVGLIMGLILTLGVIAINSALLIQIVPYVVSLKRTSILFTVLLGWLIFRETEIRRRFTGAAVMFAGICCIILCS